MNTFTREDYTLMRDAIAEAMIDLEQLLDGYEPDDEAVSLWRTNLAQLEKLTEKITAARRATGEN